MEFLPHPYGHAVHTVTREILSNRDIALRIELGADEICLPCRHNIQGLCDDTIDISFRPQAPASKREYNLLIDRRWAQRLGVRQNDELTGASCVRVSGIALTTSQTSTGKLPLRERPRGRQSCGKVSRCS